MHWLKFTESDGRDIWIKAEEIAAIGGTDDEPWVLVGDQEYMLREITPKEILDRVILATKPVGHS